MCEKEKGKRNREITEKKINKGGGGSEERQISMKKRKIYKKDKREREKNEREIWKKVR